MNIPTKFKEYIWLVNTIRKARKISLAEINELWVRTDMSGGVDLARATFNRHKDAIEDIFGIYIDCDRQDGYKYYIGNENVLRENTVQNWMLSTLSVNNLISESQSLQSRILLEPVSNGDDYLPIVIEAMKRSVRIAIQYQKYGDEEPRPLVFEPYCLKMFRQRWYVLGHFYREATEEKPEADYFGMFSFDRICEMTLTDIKFEMNPDFDAAEFFSECYGVVVNDDTEPIKVLVRLFNYERYYTRDLPLHHSQREIGRGEDYVDYELFLRPTSDFIRHLVGFGALLQVLSPDWIADEVIMAHDDAIARYEIPDDDVTLQEK